MLEVESLRVGYGGIEAVKGVDLTVAKGEVVTVLGANGAGKSSLLNSITGLVRRISGTVRLDGTDISTWAAERIARSGVGLVPEGRRTFTRLSVTENLILGAYFVSRRETRRRMDSMFSLFPVLEARRSSYAGHLSGGEQQMLAIARALMSNPRLLLCDEPSAGLSPIATTAVYEALARYVSDTSATILLVEQNVQVALQLASRGYVLELGEIKLTGSSSELLRDERVTGLYLGTEQVPR